MTDIEQYYKDENKAIDDIKKISIRYKKFFKLNSKFYKKLNEQEIKSLEAYKIIKYSLINRILFNYNKQVKLYSNDIYNYLITLGVTYNIDRSILKKLLNDTFKKKITLNNLLDIISDDLSEHITNMDSAFFKSPSIDLETKLYRGMDAKEMPELINGDIGDTITFKSFLSTSLKLKTSVKFLYVENDFFPVIIEIILNKKVKAIFLPWELSSDEDILDINNCAGCELEILFQRNSVFKIISRKNIKVKNLNISFNEIIDSDKINNNIITYIVLEFEKYNNISRYTKDRVKNKIGFISVKDLQNSVLTFGK